ncbi:ly-6/neurotoxin-like protein 1 [Lampetra fluviatilis]
MEVTPHLLILLTCLFTFLLTSGHALKCHECNGVDQCKNSKPIECPADKAYNCITDFNGTRKGCEDTCENTSVCCKFDNCNSGSARGLSDPLLQSLTLPLLTTAMFLLKWGS